LCILNLNFSHKSYEKVLNGFSIESSGVALAWHLVWTTYWWSLLRDDLKSIKLGGCIDFGNAIDSF